MTQASVIVELAKEQLGYHEQGNNLTKYAQDFDKKWPEFYNTKKNGAAWCDIFVDWCFATCFGPDKAMEMLYQPIKSCGAGCKWSAMYYKVHDAFDCEPRIGDQVFFGRPGDENHTGIVIAVTPTHIVTIEGNSANQVRKLTYDKMNNTIVGYGHPKYDDKQTSVKVGYKGGWPVLPTRGYFQKGDRGVNVRKMQCFLKWYDTNFLAKYGCDGDFGTETKAAVIAFEAREGIKTDGWFGPVCLAKAKTIKR